MQSYTVQLLHSQIELHFCASILHFFAGLSQCYTAADCTGEEVAAADQQDCCVGTNDGLSYNDGSTCNRCIGMYVVHDVQNWHENNSPASQFMDLKTLCMMLTKMRHLTQYFDSLQGDQM